MHKHIREATAGTGYILSLEFDREPVAAKILSCGSSGVATGKRIKNEVAWFSEKLNEEFREANWHTRRMGRQTMISTVLLIVIGRFRVAELKEVRRMIVSELEGIGWYSAIVILKKGCRTDFVLKWSLT